MSSYDFTKVSVIVDGTFVTGWMDGSVIKAGPNADAVTPHVGAAGETTYSETNDKTGMITLTVKQNSTFLTKALTLAASKREFSVQIVDANTNAVKAGGTICRMVKAPEISWGSEIAGVEIAIHVSDYTAA